MLLPRVKGTGLGIQKDRGVDAGALAVLVETDQSSSPQPLGAQAGVEVWMPDGRAEGRTGRGTIPALTEGWEPALTDQAEAVEPARGL